VAREREPVGLGCALRRLGLAVSVLAVCGLSGCDMVSTRRPMLSAKASGLKLAEGLWVAQDDSCPFDAKSPKTTWPLCAVEVTVRGSTARIHHGRDPDTIALFVILGDDPKIVQAYDPKTHRYLYARIGVVAEDAEGRAVQLTGAPVLCGPPTGNGAGPSVATYPGLHRRRGEKVGCTTHDVKALLNAARETPEPATHPKLTWVSTSADPQP